MSKLTEAELKLVKDLANRIKNEDPDGRKWGTRPPLWFLLQDAEEECVFSGEGGEYLIYYDNDSVYKGADCNEILQEIIAEYKENDENLNSDEINNFREKIDLDAQEVKTRYETKRVFFTEKAANDHLKQNHYHYSSKVRIYVDHAWRDPEVELIRKLILSFAGDKND